MSETRFKPFLDEKKLQNYSMIFLYAVIFGMCIFHDYRDVNFIIVKIVLLASLILNKSVLS